MYRYADHKHVTFTDEGQRTLLRTRDLARRLLKASGVVAMTKLMPSGDSWTAMAYVDRLVELGDLREIAVAAGERIFAAAGSLLE
jgi:hypothetical protein